MSETFSSTCDFRWFQSRWNNPPLYNILRVAPSTLKPLYIIILVDCMRIQFLDPQFVSLRSGPGPAVD